MSSASFHKEVCPHCGKEQLVERYDSINDYHKELFSKIVDKSIFDYTCESCKNTVHAPYPLLFHKMGLKDVQIGYKITPISIPSFYFNPLMAAMKSVMENKGHDIRDVSESYNDEDEFAYRVKDFIDIADKNME